MPHSTPDRRTTRTRSLLDAGTRHVLRPAVAPPGDPAALGSHEPESIVAAPARLSALRTSGLLDASPIEAFDRAARMVVRATGATAAAVSLVDEEHRILVSATGLPPEWTDRREGPLTRTLCRDVVERGTPIVVEDVRVRPSLPAGDLGAVAYAGVPLTTREGHTLGALAAIERRPRRWSDADRDALADLAAGIVGEIELRRLTRQLTTAANTDPVTGLGNRREWQEKGPREVARARRAGLPLVLAVLDLARFRRYNDRHGTHAGDELLRETAMGWRGTLRDGDVLVRLGGVQFALLMPVTTLDPAFDVVERLRGDLRGGVSASAGIAMLRAGESADDLLARAGRALVRAKRGGHNASALAA